jgi:hypothetical protein
LPVNQNKSTVEYLVPKGGYSASIPLLRTFREVVFCFLIASRWFIDVPKFGSKRIFLWVFYYPEAIFGAFTHDKPHLDNGSDWPRCIMLESFFFRRRIYNGSHKPRV